MGHSKSKVIQRNAEKKWFEGTPSGHVIDQFAQRRAGFSIRSGCSETSPAEVLNISKDGDILIEGKYLDNDGWKCIVPPMFVFTK